MPVDEQQARRTIALQVGLGSFSALPGRDCEEAMGYLTSTRCGSAVPPGRAADRSIQCSVMDGWIFSGRSLGSIIVDEADQELERAESNSDDAVHAAIDCR